MEKYIFLDFNGTVLNDVDICLELLNDLLIRQGKEEVSLEKYLDIFGFPVSEYYIRAGLDFSLISFEEMAEYFITEYTRRNVIECNLYPDVISFIDKAKADGYIIVLCSASRLDLLKDQLRSFKILDKFDYVIGLSDYHAKSKVDIALNFVKENNIDVNNVWFIGDTDHDDLVAKTVGGKSVLVARGHQSKKVLEKCHTPICATLLEALDFIKRG